MVTDLAATARSSSAAAWDAPTTERLAVLEDEHRVLSSRRRRLHETIDLLDGLAVVKPDAAARLERYRITEREVSRRRRDLYQQIGELHSLQLRAGRSS